MSEKIILKGITWNHSRGLTPMVATGQRFSELNPGIEISWEKRSLQEFADFSIEQLAERFDLLVIDHPWAGAAAKSKAILALDVHLSEEYLLDQEQNTVGHSYRSYTYDGHQWALPIDAATPVAASRPDLLAQKGLKLPRSFDDLLTLADLGLVAFAGIPIDVLMNFYTFCCSLGEDPCQQEDQFVSEETGITALRMFRELAVKTDKQNFHRNPIAVYEVMTQTDQFAYSPFAYGYSNYSRRGFAPKSLHFHDMISLNGKDNLRSTLGGTGLAVSATSKNVGIALKYTAYVASAECQQTVFFQNGGQPGHLSAWKDADVNHLSQNFFSNTLPALQRAFLRPRYHGHLFFQDHAGSIIREYLMYGGEEENILSALQKIYLESRKLQAL